MFDKFKIWFIGLFKKQQVQAPETQENNTDPNPDELSGSWKLSRLIEELPYFHRVLKKSDKYRSSELGGVLRMGPTIIDSTSSWVTPTDRNSRWRKLPSQFFVSFLSHRWHSKKVTPPAYLAAIKVNPPPTVEHLPGKCYYFLIYWEDGNTWFPGYLWVKGKNITIAKERRHTFNTISRNGKYPLRVPAIIYKSSFNGMFDCGGDTEMTSDEVVAMLFRSALNWWAERKKRWLVVTKDKSRRVSFSVEEGRHLYFFKDRDKTVLTPTGKRKTIFHICSEHLRRVSGRKTIVIKEHCRGIRHFFWHQYECHIFAPGWHGSDYFSEMDLEGTFYEDIVEADKNHWLDSGQVSEKLARMVEGTSVR